MNEPKQGTWVHLPDREGEHHNEYLSIGWAYTKEKFFFYEKLYYGAVISGEPNSDWKKTIEVDLAQLEPRGFKDYYLYRMIDILILFYKKKFGINFFDRPDHNMGILYVREFHDLRHDNDDEGSPNYIEQEGFKYFSLSTTFQQQLLEVGLNFNLKTEFFKDHDGNDIDPQHYISVYPK